MNDGAIPYSLLSEAAKELFTQRLGCSVGGYRLLEYACEGILCNDECGTRIYINESPSALSPFPSAFVDIVHRKPCRYDKRHTIRVTAIGSGKQLAKLKKAFRWDRVYLFRKQGYGEFIVHRAKLEKPILVKCHDLFKGRVYFKNGGENQVRVFPSREAPPLVYLTRSGPKKYPLPEGLWGEVIALEGGDAD